MNLLLDTHILLWWLADDEALSAGVRELIASEASRVFVSSATAWEIAIKSGLGTLTLRDSWMDAAVADGFEQLAVTWNHAAHVRDLPMIHRDPFDRLIVAQAREEALVVVTSDEVVTQYPVETVYNTR